MKTRVQIAILGCLLSLCAHLYLANHYYPLKYGFSTGPSVCNLNATFNCDAVSASSYSTLFDMPMAIWGLAFNLVLLTLILLGWLEWTSNPERLRRWALVLAGFSVATSVVMGSISMFLVSAFCLFCIGLYILSIIIFVALLGVPKERPLLTHLKHDVPEILTGQWGVLGALIAIPVLAWVGHQVFMQNMAQNSSGDSVAETVKRDVSESMASWLVAPKMDFVAKPSMVMGAGIDSAVLTLVEFADFRCSHCKHASYTLDAFVKSHPDVRFEFYAFPLDGACNDAIKGANGMSCRLAQAVYCAEKDGHKGWEMHHALYAAQDQVNNTTTLPELDVILAKEVNQLGLNWDQLQTCVQDAATADAIRAQAKQGGLVNVQGTPTIFANGRQLERAQLMPVLEAARAQSPPPKHGSSPN